MVLERFTEFVTRLLEVSLFRPRIVEFVGGDNLVMQHYICKWYNYDIRYLISTGVVAGCEIYSSYSYTAQAHMSLVHIWNRVHVFASRIHWSSASGENPAADRINR